MCLSTAGTVFKVSRQLRVLEHVYILQDVATTLHGTIHTCVCKCINIYNLIDLIV